MSQCFSLPIAVLVTLAVSGCQTAERDVFVSQAPYSTSPSPNYYNGGGNSYRPNPSGVLAGSVRPEAAEPMLFGGTGQFVAGPAGPSTSTPDDTANGITINLINVPVASAAKVILGDYLAVRYSIDPSVDAGRITIQTPGPVSKHAAADLFQAALRSNNAALIGARGAYRIVPLDHANSGAALLVDGDDPSAALGSQVRVVQLKYVSASEIKRILDPISPRGGVVRTDDARNAITLSGSEQDINGMLEAISIFDVDVMRGMSFGIVPVKISQPSIIAEELRTIFASNKEGSMGGMVQFLPNKRLGAILVITPQRQYLSRAVTWIRRLDRQAEGSERQFYTYSVQNRRAKDLVDVLRSVFEGDNASGGQLASRSVAPQHQEASLQTQSTPQAAPQFGGGLVSRTSSAAAPLSSAARPEPSSTAQFGQSETDGAARIKVVADDSKNAILIEATPTDYRRVMRLLGALDVMPNQVLIEATIAEITLKDDLKFGIRWFFKNGGSSYTFTDDIVGSVAQVFPGFSYAFKAANVAATLTALNGITDVNIISSPSLTVADNKTAQLQVGDQVPITTQSAVSVLTPGAPVVNSVSYKDTGVILSITPRINESGRVMLDIEQEVSTVTKTKSSTIDSPTISQRRVKTSVVVNNGEALALGGMMQDSRNVTRSQVPLLGDIPYIGSAFRMNENSFAKTELIILIAPHVIRNLNEARQVTDEFRRELAINIPYGRRAPVTLEQKFRRTFE